MVVTTLRKSNLFAKVLQCAIVVCIGIFLSIEAHTQQLSFRNYTSADGLASSAIMRITRDSRGFLWFCTRDGLSRFDGREFVNYRLNDNPTALTFWTLIETRKGDYWISTSDGLYRITPRQTVEVKPDTSTHKTGDPLKLNAEKVSGRTPNVLFEDSKGRLWSSGSNNPILIAENGQVVSEQFDLGAAARIKQSNLNVNSITEGRDGSVWFACAIGAIRLLPNGKIIHYLIPHSSGLYQTIAIGEDEQGRIWLGHRAGVFVFTPERLDKLTDVGNITERLLPIREQILAESGRIAFSGQTDTVFYLKIANPDSLQRNTVFLQVSSLYKSFDKKMWLSPLGNFLYVFDDETYSCLQNSNKFPVLLGRMTEDLYGNLWVSTRSGAMKLSQRGLSSYSQAEGLLSPDIQSIHEGADGKIYVVYGSDWHIGRIEEKGVNTARLPLPDSARLLWTSNGAMLDRTGSWWGLTDNGLYRISPTNDLSALNHRQPQKVYTISDGLKSNILYCAFHDSKGNIWFSTRGNEPQQNSLTKFVPSTETFHTYTTADGLPDGKSAVSFAEDASGNLWFGFYGGGGLARYSNGSFTNFSKAEGLPQGEVFGLHVDTKGRLWIGTSQAGVSRVDNPSAEKLSFVRYTTAEGLISNNVRALTGDLNGNIYAGTVRGISRISPESGQIQHYTTADGLTGDFVKTAFRDSKGTLWFGTDNGLSKLEPTQELKQTPAPNILISGLDIGGVRYEISEFGQIEVGGLDVSHSENNLQIDFLSVGNALRYQYKLEGSAGNQDWTNPTEQRSVNFANLAPGYYRFLVRAVAQDGQASKQPAVVSVRVRPPFWRTWWFIASVVTFVALCVFALDRYRVAKTRQVEKALTDLQKSEKERSEAENALQKSRVERLAELERVRTRIATDLHDDIGSSLTQIAFLSQVAHNQSASQPAPQNASFEKISNTAVELVEAMSDIVWAINPRKDNLSDLVQRMRRFAADVFTAQHIHFEFHAPDTEHNIQLGANIRREVFVIFKECVNNIVKHADCKNVKVDFLIEKEQLILEINDDGRGFDVEKAMAQSSFHQKGGNGLPNIQRRAKDLSGSCEIISQNGNGSTIRLRIPLHQIEISVIGAPTQRDGENQSGNELN